MSKRNVLPFARPPKPALERPAAATPRPGGPPGTVSVEIRVGLQDLIDAALQVREREAAAAAARSPEPEKP